MGLLAQLFLQLRQGQVRLLLQPASQPLANRLGEPRLAARSMGNTLHLPGTSPLPMNLPHIVQTDAKALRQLRLRAFALHVGLQNPAPQIVRKRSCHPGLSGDLAAFNLPSLPSLHYLLIWCSQCDGLTQAMSYWDLSDVFEEQGVVKQPFYGGFGLVAAGGIPKPVFYAFELLHQLGDQRIDNTNRNVLVTKAKDGSLVVATWNLVNPGDKGAPKAVRFKFKGIRPGALISINRIDEQHGNTLALYAKIIRGIPLRYRFGGYSRTRSCQLPSGSASETAS